MAKGGGHHGGAWKVAYADFITTMMALFLVLWLTAQDTKIKEAIERSFKNPFASLTKESMGIIPNPEAQALKMDRGNFDSPSAAQLEVMRRITDDLAKLLQDNPEDQATVKLDMTSEGLRISVFDHSHRPVFEAGDTRFTQYGGWVFSTIAWVIARYPTFIIELEGHSQAGIQPKSPEYSGWELSADRANASRRKLVEHGVGPQQVFKVAGYGDTQPLAGVPPESEVNRRVSVLLRIQSASQMPPESTPSPPTNALPTGPGARSMATASARP
jgi:chemotaxis protein MotB